jgi:hypothetical protein
LKGIKMSGPGHWRERRQFLRLQGNKHPCGHISFPPEKQCLRCNKDLWPIIAASVITASIRDLAPSSDSLNGHHKTGDMDHKKNGQGPSPTPSKK